MEKHLGIKLFKLESLENGQLRLQSQLYVGSNTADFIMDENGNVKRWGAGSTGFDFYEFKESYRIVDNVKEMAAQKP